MKSPFSRPSPGYDHGRIWFGLALGLGLVLRLAILTQTTGLNTEVVDEQHYLQLATNLLQGNGFAWGPGDLTSIRPPLYPALLVAAGMRTGQVDLQAVRAAQIGLALLTTFLVYKTGRMAFGRAAARLSASLFWLYPTLIFFNFLILTETLFTFLLVLMLYCSLRLLRSPGSWKLALACGIVVGLAALARSVFWPLPVLLCPLLVYFLDGSWQRRLAVPALVLAGYCVVVAPWAVRNTKLQGVFTVVDTMGGLNLRMGNYEFTPEDRIWDAVSLEGREYWSFELTKEFPGHRFTEGEKEKWAQRKAIDYILAHPDVSARRALIKFADFWSLEREFIAGVDRGMYAPPRWFTMMSLTLISISYPLLAGLAGIGLWVAAPRERRAHVVLVLPIFVITGIHTIVYGHSRYHLPLVPVLCLYAAALLVQTRGLAWKFDRRLLVGAALTCSALAFIWVRQVVFVDAGRLKAFLQHVS